MSIKNSIMFSLGQNDNLAKSVSNITKIKLGRSHLNHFADGETLFVTDEPIRGKDVYVIHSTSKPVNNSVMELLISIDALRRASAKSITAIIPYYGYSRQDRKAAGREPITSRLIADLLQKAGATRVLTFDIHSQQQQGFFSIPFDSLTGIWIMLDKFMKNRTSENVCVVSPDYGAVKRSRSISEKINAQLAIVDKRRPKPNQVEVSNILGDVYEKDCILVDDMIDTGGTMLNAAKLMKEKGAKTINIIVTHGLFNGNAVQNFNDAMEQKIIDNIYVSNTIENTILPNKAIIIKIDELLADAINVFANENACGSMSSIYSKYKYSKEFN